MILQKINYDFQKNQRLDSNICVKVFKKFEKNQIIGQNIVFFIKIVGPCLRFFEITKTSGSLIQ